MHTPGELLTVSVIQIWFMIVQCAGLRGLLCCPVAGIRCSTSLEDGCSGTAVYPTGLPLLIHSVKLVLNLCCMAWCCRSDITWMQQHHLYQPSAADSSPKHTLEQQLLQQWDDVTPTYDAVFVHHLPTAEELLTSLSPSVLEITLLANQSAIAAIPAALNQATSALLRMMLAAKEAAGIKQLVAGDAQEGGSCSSDDAADSEISSASDMSSGHACGATGDTQQQYPTATAAAEPATGAPAGEYFEAAAVPSCCSISASSQPLPLIPGETFFKLSQELTALGFVLCASIALSLLAASFAPFLVRCAVLCCC